VRSTKGFSLDLVDVNERRTGHGRPNSPRTLCFGGGFYQGRQDAGAQLRKGKGGGTDESVIY